MSEQMPDGRRFKFDPTVNLGHMLSASVFLVSGAVAFATLTLRVDQTERTNARIERDVKADISRVERQADEARARIERRFDEDQRRDRESFVEIKVLLRDIDKKLDQKQDKPR